MGKRVLGSNSHGFNNEKLMVESLNNKKIKELNTNLKMFIKDICRDNKITVLDNMIIGSRIEKCNKFKQDFYISIQGKEFGISTKMGTGNSVHQEKIEEFISWLSSISSIKITNEIKDDLRLCIWGDGTLNGQAPIKKGEDEKIIGRFNLKGFKKLYPQKRNQIQKFFEENSYVILNRAIFKGKNNSKVDYIYHGTPESGVWISKNEILEYNIKNPKGIKRANAPTLSVGRLTVQPWNVSLEGTEEKRRGQIQFKYSSIVKDFENLMFMKASNIGTFQGDKEELNLSQIMNRNKNHKYWDILSDKCKLRDDKENYYIVKVDGNKSSKLSGTKVKCKSDVFVIETVIDKSYLLQNEYQLTEKNLKDFTNYKIVKNSGISVKRADSKKYTIIKLTNNSFKKAFGKYLNNIEFILAGLLLYSKKSKQYINKIILEDLKIEEDELKKYYLDNFKIEGEGIYDEDYISKISIKAKKLVKDVIESNIDLKACLFTGKGWFEDPYCIEFIFKYGNLTTEMYTDYVISNGSGRSKGVYSIILKPQ